MQYAKGAIGAVCVDVGGIELETARAGTLAGVGQITGTAVVGADPVGTWLQGDGTSEREIFPADAGGGGNLKFTGGC